MSEPLVIAPEGELDFATVGPSRDAVVQAGTTGEAAVIVDLSRVSFIDSTGLGALIELQARLQRSRRRLAVVAPAGTAAAVVLNLGGLSNRFEVFETRPEGLSAGGRFDPSAA